ncbi:integrase [Acidihalobacter yilgarnensis]|uniref:Integrase n=1 Tax=Acidihalobacter yilgarnensis TaxID=2819280 RepID=A0A1D8IMY9_9GAMM|nr:IS3 family transposase [Acidihalobacter yilgarnensis]AOU97827.1 integrase [Acidihalobacter yilgarnensis]
MIERTHKFPVLRQAKLLDVSRSSVYYLSQPTSDADMQLIRRIDPLHLVHPFAGVRMLRDLLKLEGFKVGRKHVATPMKKMGIEALYRKANTSRRNSAHGVSAIRIGYTA